MADDKEHEPHKKEIKVFINGHEKKIRGGKYTIAELKHVLDVPTDDELAVIRNKKPVPFKDGEEVHEGEKFVSHKRRGGSS